MTKNGEKRSDVAALIKTQLPALLLFARQWPHNSPEDIVQEAFIKLLEQQEMPENVTAWLFAVVRNLSNNHLRSEKRRKNRENTRNTQWFAEFEQTAETDENQKELIEQLQTLPISYREVIVAKIWGKLTFEEIAVINNTSSSSVHRNYKAGLEMLHEKLKEIEK